MAEDDSEKTHEPTPEKLRQAREKGELARSADIGVAAIYVAMLVAFAAFGAAAAQGAGAAMAGILGGVDRLEGRILGPGGSGVALSAVTASIAPLLPILLAPFAAAALAYAAQQAIVVAPDKIVPKLSRISILSNAKNKFGPTGLVEFAKSTVKLCAIMGILAWFLLAETDRMAALVRADPRVIGPEMMRVGVALLSIIAAVASVIAAVDYVWQRFDHARKNRMSHQELRDEHKKSEGDPHMKGERRRRAQAIAMNQMMAAVPKADVVIVNPTHYAVALKWSRKSGAAPECVAKGVDEIALAIRRAAAEHAVPVRHDPPTARALHATVEVGQEIPPDHYKAVAAAIRYAEQMRDIARQRGLR